MTGRANHRRLPRQGWLIVGSLLAVAAVAIVVAAIRYGPLTPAGRLFVAAQASGLKIGRLGTLRVEGVRGDVWSDFSVERLAIADEKGVWLDARGVRVHWRYAELFRRRLHIDLVTARLVTLVRRPTLRPKEKSRGLPLSFEIDRSNLRLVMMPAFSARRGVYDLAAVLDVERAGGGRARIFASSVLHPGDFLRMTADLHGKQFRIDADASEAKGGALAGSLGMAPDQAFTFTARAQGAGGRGRLSLATRVGSAQPLRMSGAWTPLGGEAAGTIQLGASRLLARYRAMLGDQAAFAVAGLKARDGLYGIGLTLRSQNATVAASGDVDIGRQAIGPHGLAVTGQVADAGRLLSWPPMGPAQVRGRLGGDVGHWVFAGDASVERLAASGFTLARVFGPLRLEARGGELSLGAAARGEGGAGRSVAAALLGARPAGSLELTVLSDGRLLMRRLALHGPGLEVAASGERGLFGGLSFRGSARFTNFAFAHAGARGIVQANWSASQAGGSKPWSVSLDATGKNFAAGLGEVDRLLGSAPRLRVTAELQRGVIALSLAVVDGAAGSLAGAGTLSTNGTLAVKLDWRAQGPFHAGPLEIAGAATGSGALTGTLASPRADLMANVDRVDLPSLPLERASVRLTFAGGQGAEDGHLSVAGSSPYGPARGATAFRFVPGGLDLSRIDLSAGGVEASGALLLAHGGASRADLTFRIGAGALLAEGRAAGRLKIADAPGGPRASLDLTGADARLRGGGPAITAMTIHAEGPIERLPYELSARGASRGSAWRMTGSGAYASSGGDHSLSFNGAGRFAALDFRTLEPAMFRIGPAGSSADLHLAAGDGRADVQMSDAGSVLSARATVSRVSLRLLNPDLIGRLEASAELHGRGSSLTGSGLARLSGAGGRDLKGEPPVDGTIKANLAAGVLAIDAAFTNANGLRATTEVTIPAEASAAPFRIAINRASVLHGRFVIDGEMKPVWDLLMGGDRSLSGRVTAAGALSGTLADPKAVGTASLEAGRFDDVQTGLVLRDVGLAAVLSGNSVDVGRFAAVDGVGGSVSGQGRISLERNGASSFRLVLRRFRLIDNDLGQAAASGVASVSRTADGRVKLSGALTIDKAQIAPKAPVPSGVVAMDVVEVHRPARRAEENAPVPTPPSPIALDVTFTAPRGLFVKGRGLDVELALEARVEGTTAFPILTGDARIVRGDYDFAGKRFRFDDRGSVRLGSRPELIRLDLTATREDPSLTAVIRIRGTAAKPEITLTSSPVLPADEVLSQVLFGASASQLSPLEAAQLASALSGLAGGGGFDVLGSLRTFAHLDRLAFAGSAATGSAVVGGKYLSDNLYLELGGGGREGPSAQVEWRVRKHLSIVSRLTGQGDSQISIRWRKDY